MRLRFNGGPWDGVEFDAAVCPEAINFKVLHCWSEEGKAFPSNIRSKQFDHHQYLFDQPRVDENVPLVVGENLDHEPEMGEHITDIVDPSLIIQHFRYALGETPEFVN